MDHSITTWAKFYGALTYYVFIFHPEVDKNWHFLPYFSLKLLHFVQTPICMMTRLPKCYKTKLRKQRNKIDRFQVQFLKEFGSFLKQSQHNGLNFLKHGRKLASFHFFSKESKCKIMPFLKIGHNNAKVNSSSSCKFFHQIYEQF